MDTGIHLQAAPFLLIVILLVFCITPSLCVYAQSDTIVPGQYLTGNQTIVSHQGNFALGFFTPGSSNKFYIGVWYNKISEHTVVWVANRETPLPDTSSVMKISEDGNLVLAGQSGVAAWSTNLTRRSSSNSTLAVLLDTGNLVLRDGSDPSSALLWQSFDHPTHTWLPGSSLGMNKITGEKQMIRAWRSWDDPAAGPFSLEVDTSSSQYFLLWNRSEIYWTSGEWNGEVFSQVPEMRTNFIFNFSYWETQQVKYFTYSVFSNSTITRFVMDVTGQIKQFVWLDGAKSWMPVWTKPREFCSVYSACGTFASCSKSSSHCTCLQGFEPSSEREWSISDWSGGCIRTTPLQCELNTSASYNNNKHSEDSFLPLLNVQLPVNSKATTGLLQGVEGCESACLEGCSCTAYSYGSSSCLLWNNQLRFSGSSDTDNAGNLYIRLAASDMRRSKSKGRISFFGTVIGIGMAVVVVVAASAAVVVLLLVRSRRKRSVRISNRGNGSGRGSGRGKAVEAGTLVAFSYRDLQVATKNFSEKVGGGGFGFVFKGWMPAGSSTPIAVKRLEGSVGQGEKQFRAEVSTIGNVQHVNLIRLRGFCCEGSQRLLVYDYMQNGSLDRHLFHMADPILDWSTRYRIALGTARGLAYLHEKCRDCIIHCDIKPENILLDDEFCPKVADLGLAKLLGRDFSRVLTTIRGTRGYLAPEWISGVAITPKADVYSFGMMLFEVVSGRRNIGKKDNGETDFYPAWAAKKLIEGDQVDCLVDARLKGEADREEVERACRVACWCIQEDEAHRPSMGQVAQILEGVLEVNMPPLPKAVKLYEESLVISMDFSNSTLYTCSGDGVATASILSDKETPDRQNLT